MVSRIAGAGPVAKHRGLPAGNLSAREMHALLRPAHHVDIEIDDAGGRIVTLFGFARSGLPDDGVTAQGEPVVEMVRAVGTLDERCVIVVQRCLVGK